MWCCGACPSAQTQFQAPATEPFVMPQGEEANRPADVEDHRDRR